MKKIALTAALADYDHVRDLALGRVQPDGIELTCLTLPIEEIFFRFIVYREWEVSEISLAKYVALTAQGDESYWALPVFPVARVSPLLDLRPQRWADQRRSQISRDGASAFPNGRRRRRSIRAVSFSTNMASISRPSNGCRRG